MTSWVRRHPLWATALASFFIMLPVYPLAFTSIMVERESGIVRGPELPAWADVSIGIVMITAAVVLGRTRALESLVPDHMKVSWKYADEDWLLRLHRWMYGAGVAMFVLGMGGLMFIAGAGSIAELIVTPPLVLGSVALVVMTPLGFWASFRAWRVERRERRSTRARDHG